MADRLDALRDRSAIHRFACWCDSRCLPVVVIATLTLGIAATTAIFHAVDRVVLHPLPYPESRSHRLSRLEVGGTGGGSRRAVAEEVHVLATAESRLRRSRNVEELRGNRRRRSSPERSRAACASRPITCASSACSRALGRAFSKDEFTAGRRPSRFSATRCGSASSAAIKGDRSKHSARRAPVHGHRRDAGVVRGGRTERMGAGAPVPSRSRPSN